MKIKLLLILCGLIIQFKLSAQQFQSVNFPNAFVHTYDIFNDKLVVSGADNTQAFDGVSWEAIPNTHASYSANAIGNLLYIGSGSFPTNGADVVKVYDGTATVEKQGNRQFSYNANKKIMGFVSVGDSVYTSDRFDLFVWDESLEKWRSIFNRTSISFSNEIKQLISFNNKIYLITPSGVLQVNADYSVDTITDAMYNMNKPNMYGGGEFMFKHNNTLYITGNFSAIDQQSKQHIYNLLKLENGSLTGYKLYFGEDSSKLAPIRIIYVDSDDLMYCIGSKNDTSGDIHFMKYEHAKLIDLGMLVKKGEGLYPDIPGSEIGDYNSVFKYKNEIFIGGRFEKIAGQEIKVLAKYTGGGSNGIQNANAQHLSLYPIPATHNITFNSNVELTEIRVIDITGAVMRTSKITNNQLDVSSLSAGIYYVVANDELGNVYHAKMVKQ